eukprot:XP_028337331.1 uncharacterized protein LOC114484546 [Physeter catodon]
MDMQAAGELGSWQPGGKSCPRSPVGEPTKERGSLPKEILFCSFQKILEGCQSASESDTDAQKGTEEQKSSSRLSLPSPSARNARLHIWWVVPIPGTLESSQGPGCPHCWLSVLCVTHNCLLQTEHSLGRFPRGHFSLASFNSCHTVPVVFQEGGLQSFIEADLNLTLPICVWACTDFSSSCKGKLLRRNLRFLRRGPASHPTGQPFSKGLKGGHVRNALGRFHKTARCFPEGWGASASPGAEKGLKSESQLPASASESGLCAPADFTAGSSASCPSFAK